MPCSMSPSNRSQKSMICLNYLKAKPPTPILPLFLPNATDPRLTFIWRALMKNPHDAPEMRTRMTLLSQAATTQAVLHHHHPHQVTRTHIVLRPLKETETSRSKLDRCRIVPFRYPSLQYGLRLVPLPLAHKQEPPTLDPHPHPMR